MELNRKIGTLSLRWLLGFIILIQGFAKVFTWGVDNIYIMHFFHNTLTPYFPYIIIRMTAYYTSYVELIAGALSIYQFKKRLYPLSNKLSNNYYHLWSWAI